MRTIKTTSYEFATDSLRHAKERGEVVALSILPGASISYAGRVAIRRNHPYAAVAMPRSIEEHNQNIAKLAKSGPGTVEVCVVLMP